MLSYCRNKALALISDQRFSEILHGSAWVFVAQITATFIGLGTNIFIARWYGADVIGIVAVISSVLSIASIFTVMGNNTAILRFIPEHLVRYSPKSAYRVYRQSRLLVICGSLAIGLLLLFSSGILAKIIFSKPHLAFYLALSAPFLLFHSINCLNTAAVRALRLIRVYSSLLVLPPLINLLTLVLLTIASFNKGNPVFSLFASLATVGMISWLVIDTSFRENTAIDDTLHPVSSRDILTVSLPMMMTSSLFIFMNQTAILLLGIYQTETQVGYYNIAIKLSSLVTFVLIAINAIIAPRFAELFHAGNLDELFYVAKKSAKLIFWISTPILLVIVIFGKPILHYAFGREFVQAYPALLILVMGQFFNVISGSTGLFMNMTNHEKLFRNIMFFAVLLDIGLCFGLIPSFGIMGAAIASMVGITCLNGLQLFSIKKKYGHSTGYLPFGLGF